MNHLSKIHFYLLHTNHLKVILVNAERNIDNKLLLLSKNHTFYWLYLYIPAHISLINYMVLFSQSSLYHKHKMLSHDTSVLNEIFDKFSILYLRYFFVVFNGHKLHTQFIIHLMKFWIYKLHPFFSLIVNHIISYHCGRNRQI